MIPLRTALVPRGIPVVNRALLAVNIGVWIYVVALSRDPAALDAFYARYSFDWSELVRAVSGGTATVDAFVPLLTHMFVHGGWLHVLGNMLYLWIFGDAVEDALGGAPYLALYLLSGVAAAVAQGIVAPAPMVGASGAIAGVLGAYLVLAPASRVSTLIFLPPFITMVDLPALVVIGMFIVLQVIAALADLRLTGPAAAQEIAYFAHVFGFLAGILLLTVLRRGGGRRARTGWG